MSLYNQYLKEKEVETKGEEVSKNLEENEIFDSKEKKENSWSFRELEEIRKKEKKKELHDKIEKFQEVEEEKQELKEDDSPKNNKDIIISTDSLPPKLSPFKKFLIRFVFFIVLLIFIITSMFTLYWFFILEDKDLTITNVILNIFK